MSSRPFFILLVMLACSAGAAEEDGYYFSKAGRWPSGTNVSEIIRLNSEIAQRALAEFRDLVDEETYAELGFKSVEEIKAATIETPIVVYWIGLKDLQEYDTNRGTAAVLRNAWKVIYPLSAEGEVRSSVTLQKLRGKWAPSDFGFADFARTLHRTRSEIAERTQLALTNIFGLEIPALNLDLLAYQREGNIMLTPIFSQPSLKLEAGKSLPANEMLKHLVPAARNRGKGPG